MSQNGKEDHNVVDLASARKRQRTVQTVKGAQGGGKGARKGASSGQGGPARTVGQKLATAVQLLVVLGAVFYLLQLCRGPG